VTQRQ